MLNLALSRVRHFLCFSQESAGHVAGAFSGRNYQKVDARGHKAGKKVRKQNFSPLNLYHKYFIDMFAIQNKTHDVISYSSYRGHSCGGFAKNRVREVYYCNI
jgi:hypothetical protein